MSDPVVETSFVPVVARGLAERRLPTQAEIDDQVRYAVQRAREGVPLENLTAAYQRGLRGIWERLAETADATRPEDLLDLADLLWAWLPVLTSAAARGYEQALSFRRHTGELVELLSTGQAGTEACRALARANGFDPDGDFQVVSAPEPRDHAALDRAQARWTSRAGRIVVLCQKSTAQESAAQESAAQESTIPLGPVTGTSLVRPGLPGAAAALLDADSALDLAVALRRPVDFRTDWLWITMLRHLDRLRPLLGAGRPADQPQLGEAARAYGDGGWSIAGAAVHLGLHPNTVRSRLERLGQLAHLDPRTMAGQRLSVLQDLASAISPPPPSRDAGPEARSAPGT